MDRTGAGCSYSALFQLELDQLNPGRADIFDGTGVAPVLPEEVAELERPCGAIVIDGRRGHIRCGARNSGGRCGFQTALARADRTPPRTPDRLARFLRNRWPRIAQP